MWINLAKKDISKGIPSLIPAEEGLTLVETLQWKLVAPTCTMVDASSTHGISMAEPELVTTIVFEQAAKMRRTNSS